MRDDPTLRLLPVAVGGRADQRGVVATCNYAAREFGVRSAMATSQALQRCPGLIVIPPSMEKYRIASRQILAIYRDYTNLVEPLSLDEAYLDVTHCTHHDGSATRIAQEIRARIEATVGITPLLASHRINSSPRLPVTGINQMVSSLCDRTRLTRLLRLCRLKNYLALAR